MQASKRHYSARCLYDYPCANGTNTNTNTHKHKHKHKHKCEHDLNLARGAAQPSMYIIVDATSTSYIQFNRLGAIELSLFFIF